MSRTRGLPRRRTPDLVRRVTLADSTRRIYEQRPYPATNRSVLRGRYTHLPPLDWIQAIGRPGQPLPARALVAGCGTGAEAFELRRALPEAEIVAIDFSARSIAIARQLQRAAPPARPVRFAVADLTDANLPQLTGGGFDLISCHGVLSYIPEPQPALANLRAAARPGAVLYLGVNGEGHHALRLRQWLTRFGLPVDQLGDERRLRDLLRLWDGLRTGPAPKLADLPASYLAGDVCGHLFNNWGIRRWGEVARRAGWQLRTSWMQPALLRTTLPASTHRSLFPAEVTEVLARLDEASPGSFHRLLLQSGTDAEPAWDGSRSPSEVELRWSGLYSFQLQRARRNARPLAILRCPALNLRLEWPLNAAQADFVAQLAHTDAPWVRCPAACWRTEAGRRLLWLWSGFGVIVARRAAAGPGAVFAREPIR